ncbi:uncharacterized protein N7477_009024 [Penicillium maclennaniae]|uniref:uncharacterized protein n=1 Tax=Penicillium maclennaniae TaxID=1343394 RepID=UPI002541A11B|nr:uncharacterized protein N7477_009024 [Penicillium maclennaniae]KAJ5661408.1 hypothetical protein N7477_009024 [Penicillium maclennaniae]
MVLHRAFFRRPQPRLEWRCSAVIPRGPGCWKVHARSEMSSRRFCAILPLCTSTSLPRLRRILRNYNGWFHSDDDLINKIWYAGAYTNQLCTINPTHGDALVHFGGGAFHLATTSACPKLIYWWSIHNITSGSSTITDGA